MIARLLRIKPSCHAKYTAYTIHEAGGVLKRYVFHDGRIQERLMEHGERQDRERFNIVVSEHANGIILAMATFYWLEDGTLGS